MSYEGYTQFLCASGHLHIRDAYDDAPFVWRHDVDDTNGDGVEVRLKKKTDVELSTCPICNHIKVSKASTYYIPNDVGRKMKVRTGGLLCKRTTARSY